MFARLRSATPLGVRTFRDQFESKFYLRYGLLRDDMLRESDEVKEAIRRLPKQVQDERNFRCVRAMQFDMNHRELPKELWTKPEDDKPYLQPYIQEVLKEQKEKEEWYKTH